MNPFVICKAAAGSGKTFTLVREYLKLAMLPPRGEGEGWREHWERWLPFRFAGILAITFTNKAAGEMKSRVMDSLLAIAASEPGGGLDGMGGSLLDALNSTPEYSRRPLQADELRRMAAVLYSAVLHRYTDLSVCTIDSFMHRVVRTFAHELDKPVDFEVMIDHDELVEQAVEGLMAQVGKAGNEELTRVVEAFSRSRMEEDKGYRIEGALVSLAAQLFREDASHYLDALSQLRMGDFIDMQRELSEENRRFERQVADCGARMMEALSSIGVADIDCAGGAKGFYGYFRSVAEGSVRPLTKTAAKAFEEGRLCSAKCGDAAREALDEAAPDLTDIYLDLRSLVGVAEGGEDDEGGPLRDYSTRLILLRNIYSMALLGELNSRLRQYAAENGVVHLSEFNQMIGGIVAEQPAPFIYERLGNRYRHFLIDEFQDTSVLQWHNLVPLLENGVSQRHESLVVGDGKQAIYRFRQGDVRQFVALPRVEGLPLHGQTLAAEGNYSQVQLTENYRTAERIVAFNNGFFEWLLAHSPYSGNELAQQIYIGRRDGEGRPELFQHLPEGGRPGGRVDLRLVEGDAKEGVCEHIRATIERLVTEEGYRQSDIMVLARYNRELDVISTYLQSHHEGMRIEVTSSESFFLCRSHAVMALVSALRLVDDPSDRVAAASLMQCLFALGLVASPHDDDFLGGGVSDVRSMLLAEGRGFDLRLDYLASLDLYDCCEEAVRQLHLDGFDTAYVASLLGRVNDYSVRHHDGVGGFLSWFDEHASADFTLATRRQLSAASPEGVDAVRLLTIHKAKGLEAPVVIVPVFASSAKGYSLWVDLGEGLPIAGHRLPAAYVELGQKSSTRFDPTRDAERRLHEVDMLNVLYVALTRPREQLYVVGVKQREDSKAEPGFAQLMAEYIEQCNPDLGGGPTRGEAPRGAAQATAEAVPLRHVSFADWTSKVQVASPAENALTPLLERSIRLGNWLHAAMALVGDAQSVDKALSDFADREALPDGDMEEVARMVRAVVSHPEAGRFFGHGCVVKTECDMVDAQGVIRPDRIVLAQGETWVVDFKTGRDMGADHDRQLARYCAALREMGYPRVSGWLVYAGDEVRVRQAAV